MVWKIEKDFAVAAVVGTPAAVGTAVDVDVSDVVGWHVHGWRVSHCHCCCCHSHHHIVCSAPQVAVDCPASSGVAAVVGGCSCRCTAVAVGHGSNVVDDCGPGQMLLGCVVTPD